MATFGRRRAAERRNEERRGEERRDEERGDEAPRTVPPPGPPPTLFQQPAGLARHWQPVTVGPHVPAFAPLPPTGLSYRPDTVCDGWRTPTLDLRLASVRGYQHRHDGRPREDDAAAAWEPGTGTVVFAVADGVSDAEQPHIGAQLACRSAVDEMLAQVRDGEGFVADWQKLLSTVHWQLVEQTRRIRGADAGVEETAALLATTLVAGTATPTDRGLEIGLLWVGDSGVWQIKWEKIHQLVGGKAPGPDGLVSSAVEPLPYIPDVVRSLDFVLEPDTVLLIGTDGFGDPLGDGNGDVARLFRTELRSPVPPLGFAHLLDFSRETYDDDRTLIALWPRGQTPGGRE
ncbi:protein phosphatase 2C domain-containing protein [Streptomyces fulvoviolaceus]|uniref:protein phosphatase 2C domain-containing protein n=1 Tax=Streptomyces fulvoviolaceus TaxID=285535 RepID=UPI0021C24A84|nr:protein phosphatase 2C domain-containing protein [Streptomyces fulvoviolaceus]MCT9080110.1 protein phosphatase 2C domain-containing protein [Streptomyces fulvoviolaceus]